MTKATLQLITYQLDILLTEPARLSIGKLGAFDFPAGQYVYTGSAQRNIKARIARHLRREKMLKWHIDYLLASPQASIIKVMQYAIPECEMNQRTAGRILIAGFGSSDCHAGCGSHLKYLI
ncbi:MAG: GIY-YIG nuclease family protein [Methylotenera sp.]|nr:GIY-YIG nuclease family protein [Methylotenera sp.]